MDKRKIRMMLKSAQKDINKKCSGCCKKCTYNIADVRCDLVHLLYWLAEHDEIIKKIKESENEKQG